VTQEIPCVATLNKQKYHSFLYKIREQEGRTGPVGEWLQWEGEEVGKECGRVNIMQILCTHVCK
jgi:hypothetical protein